MGEVRVSQLSNSEISQWNGFVDSHPAAKIYHRAEWRALIKDVFGHDAFYLLAKDQAGQINGVLPLIKMESLLFGKFGISLPFFNYGGPLGVDDRIENLLIQHAQVYYQKSQLEFLEFRDEKPRQTYPARTDKVTMILELSGDADEVFNSFKAKLRSQIRRPMRENIEIVFGRDELLDDFYLAFTTNMRDLGTPPYNKKFFKEILLRFPENSYLAVAKKQGEVAGAAFLLGYKDTLEIPWASTIRKFNPLGVNMLMYWEVIKSAIDRDYNYFDFGRCSRGAGTYRFKQQWGSVEKQLYWHYVLLQMDELPRINPDNGKYKLFIDMWKKLPMPMTKIIGPTIVKNIP